MNDIDSKTNLSKPFIRGRSLSLPFCSYILVASPSCYVDRTALGTLVCETVEESPQPLDSQPFWRRCPPPRGTFPPYVTLTATQNGHTRATPSQSQHDRTSLARSVTTTWNFPRHYGGGRIRGGFASRHSVRTLLKPNFA